MFKNAQDKQDHLERTGSHATKHSATGRGGVLPPDAEPWACIFNDLRQQHHELNEHLDRVVLGIEKLNWMLKGSSDPDDQRRLLLKRASFIKLNEQLKARSGELRAQIVMAARSSVGMRFMEQAKAMLLPEQYKAIKEAAYELVDDKALMHFSWKPVVRDRADHGAPSPAKKERDKGKRSQQRKLQNLAYYRGVAAKPANDGNWRNRRR